MEELEKGILEYAQIIKFIVLLAPFLLLYLILTLGRICHYSKLQKKELTALNHNIIKLLNRDIALGINQK
jgi:hypothetical protein